VWCQLRKRCHPAAPRSTLQNESPFSFGGFAPLADGAKRARWGDLSAIVWANGTKEEVCLA
jgi:hypothetical protein